MNKQEALEQYDRLCVVPDYVLQEEQLNASTGGILAYERETSDYGEEYAAAMRSFDQERSK